MSVRCPPIKKKTFVKLRHINIFYTKKIWNFSGSELCKCGQVQTIQHYYRIDQFNGYIKLLFIEIVYARRPSLGIDPNAGVRRAERQSKNCQKSTPPPKIKIVSVDLAATRMRMKLLMFSVIF